MRRGAQRRVVVTGIGVVSCAGIGAEAFWQGLLTVPPDRRLRPVEGFDPEQWLSRKQARRIDRHAQFALVAAQEAFHDAAEPDYAPALSGVVAGTGIGGCGTFEEQVLVQDHRGPDRVSPLTVPAIMPNAACAHIAMARSFRGPAETPATACAAGTHAVGQAARLVSSGRCDLMIAGGSEAAITPTAVAGMANIGALSPTGISRPFDARRDGFAISEGAGFLVLEEREQALARGARVYCEVAGAASTCDAHHLVEPLEGGAGAESCMRLALEDAEVSPADVTHVNAHGTSTPLNDAAEAGALARLFGDHRPAVTSIKGVTGHSFGAAGALEAVAVALSYAHRLIPPTLGHQQPLDGLAINVVSGAPRLWEPGPTLSNSFGFGGHNGSLVFLP